MPLIMKHCHLFLRIGNKWDVSLEQKKLVYALLRIYVVNSTTNNMFFMYMYKWSNFKDKYVVFRVFKIQTWDWEQVTPFRDSTIGVRKLYLYLLYRWLSARYLHTYYLESCRHSLSYYLGNYTVFGLEEFMHLCPEKLCILTVR